MDEIKLHFSNVNAILHLGDLTSLDIIEKLEEMAPVDAVSGNMDRIEIRERIKASKVVSHNHINILMKHNIGIPSEFRKKNDKLLKENNIRIVLSGHTHKPFNEIIDGILFFNPGSCVKSFFSDQKTIGIIEIPDSGHPKGTIIVL